MLRKARSYFNSSSFKMALFFTIMLGLTLCVLGYFVYYFSRGNFVRDTEMVIETDISHFKKWNEQNLLVKAINDESLLKDKAIFYADKNGQYIAGNLKELPENISFSAKEKIVFDWNNKKYVARTYNFPGGNIILVAVNVDSIRNNSILMSSLSILSIIFVGVVIFVSFAISIFVVTRTNRIATAAKEIMETGNLSKRIEVDSKWDDLSYVATVLNSFLSKIQMLIENIKQVSDNIAHDLRTPLTRLRNDLEKLKDGDQNNPEKYDQVIAESDHVLNIFSALLRISKIESGHGKEYFQKIDVSKIVADVADLYEPLAESKKINLNVILDPYMFFGDKDLLFQAMANLFDNAIKFTPDNGKIDVTMIKNGVFSICDSGLGVAENEKDRIFKRFYRAESTRTSQGNGLGLSLVEAVIRLHSLDIAVENLNPGLKVTIKFKQALNITKV